MGEFFQETIDNHRKTFDPSNIRDLVDTYLLEIEKSKAEGTSDNLFEGRDPGKFNLTFKLLERRFQFCFFFRSSNAANHRRSLFRRNGNHQNDSSLVKTIHDPLSRSNGESSR